MTLFLLLALSASAFAQHASSQAAINPATEIEAGNAAVTGQTVTQDVTGRTVFVTSQQPTPPLHDYRAEFDALDVDKDGSINPDETSADKYLARTFASYDSDGDNRLSFEEARRWLED